MNDKCNCCDIKSMCGYSLGHGVTFVGFASITISLVVLISAGAFISQASKKEYLYYKQPVLAINVLCALYCISVSVYQITKGNVFLCTLWYVSHLSIVTFYTMFSIARTIICISVGSYMAAVLTLILGTSYDAVFIYFCVTVNSYIHSLVQDRCF